MENKNLLWFGLGAVAVYLFLKNKQQQNQNNSTIPDGTPCPLGELVGVFKNGDCVLMPQQYQPHQYHPHPMPQYIPEDYCDFPQNCADGTFGCNCNEHGGLLSYGTCARGEVMIGGVCRKAGQGLELVALQDIDTSVMDRPDHYVQKTFKKGDTIFAIIYPAVDIYQPNQNNQTSAPRLITTYSGLMPSLDMEGELWFPIDIDKVSIKREVHTKIYANTSGHKNYVDVKSNDFFKQKQGYFYK